MSFISTVISDLKFAATHPAVVRKELLSVAGTVSTEILAFNTVVHGLPASVQTVVAGVSGVATFILTFLGKNESVADAKAKAKS